MLDDKLTDQYEFTKELEIDCFAIDKEDHFVEEFDCVCGVAHVAAYPCESYCLVVQECPHCNGFTARPRRGLVN